MGREGGDGALKYNTNFSTIEIWCCVGEGNNYTKCNPTLNIIFSVVDTWLEQRYALYGDLIYLY